MDNEKVFFFFHLVWQKYSVVGVESFKKTILIIDFCFQFHYISMNHRHILPKTLSEQVKQKGLSNEEMEELMAERNYTIVVYLHGSTHSR